MVHLYFYAKSEINVFFKDHFLSIQYNYPENIISLISDLNIIIMKINERNKNDFFIFYQSLPDLLINVEEYDKRFFIFNTEQLTRPNMLQQILNLNIKINYIDYSFSNIEIINNKKNIFYLPYMVNKNEILNIQKTKDVCFIGAVSPYRTKIINMLKKKGTNVDIIDGWEKERDLKLFSYKILLNIHYILEYKVFEQLRCNRCIMNKMIVISEKNADTYFEMKEHLIETEYENLVSTVIYVLSNYEMVYQNLFKNFDINKIEKNYKLIGDNFMSCLENFVDN